MKKLTILLAGILCALAITTSTLAAESTNAPADTAWTLTLGGTGATTTSGNSQSAFGADLSIGHTGFLVLPLEAGVRQQVTYNDGATVLTTKLYGDWTLFSVSRLDLFAGANVGLSYGNTPLAWTAAPEAGVRLWIKKDVAVIGRVEYPFEINNLKPSNTLSYFLGIQVKF